MSSNIKISERILSETHALLDNENRGEKAASSADLVFINEGFWLKDSAVIDIIRNRQGAWDVSLVFAHYKNPLQLIVRTITRCFSKQKAQAAAFYIRKEAAKDRRGTLDVSIDDLHICFN